jgi:hypothetical protein
VVNLIAVRLELVLVWSLLRCSCRRVVACVAVCLRVSVLDALRLTSLVAVVSLLRWCFVARSL